MLKSISPIDGRYAKVTSPLADYFSEYALIRYRVLIEIKYFEALCHAGLPQLVGAIPHIPILRAIVTAFSEQDALEIKRIESITNHDVKAVEYFIKQKIDHTALAPWSEFIHFGLTSQDINNTAQPLALSECNTTVLYPLITKLIHALIEKAELWMDEPMLAYTHGQPASPTTLGKEIKVFAERLRGQFTSLQACPITAKFGGATGNFNAHAVAYPYRDWHTFGDQFVYSLGLQRIRWTTQIEPYDYFAAYCHNIIRINTICIDLCRDIWMYISRHYLKQKTIATEVGSSAMPHKVNPIDFENAEGNLGIANALFSHFAEKLPISRLQRDLTDSTVLRNSGVPIGHTLIAIQSLLKGLGKIEINKLVIDADLTANWAVIAEAIQTILRREGIKDSYELLKDFSRGKAEITKADFQLFISNLSVPDTIKNELSAIHPANYIGQIR
ncbi:MAG: adenylosuccinate lyase [Saprospiraceae bacterium]|nr:adenylosuccinate lyase [Saprospiraceae bacterium]MBP8097576.1 adenylosuccinate lyase [Saprospiraceae bacterium]